MRHCVPLKYTLTRLRETHGFEMGWSACSHVPSEAGQRKLGRRFSLGGLFGKVCFGWWGMRSIMDRRSGSLWVYPNSYLTMKTLDRRRP